MGWQDELRELDARLAAGSVSADDYRRARDELLRKAQSGGVGEPAQQPQSGPFPAQQPQSGPFPAQQPPSGPFPAQQQPPSGPFPAQQQPAEPTVAAPFTPSPFKWNATPPQDTGQKPANDSTQVIQPVADPRAGSAGEQTQVVPGSRDMGSSDRTQVVRGMGAQDQGQWGATPQAPPPWAQQQPQASSPWGQDPVVPPDMNWMRTGPEAFEQGPPKKRGKVIGIAIAAVLVVGLGVAAFFYFTGDKSTPNNPPPQAGGTSQAPTSTTVPLPEPPPTKPEPADAASTLIDPPGTARGGGGKFNAETMQTGGLLPKPVVTAWTEAGFKQGLLKTTVNDPVTYGLFAVDFPDTDAAATAAKAYKQAQLTGGLQTVPEMSMKGVPVYTAGEGADPVYRAVYVVYGRVVIVEAFGKDRQAVQAGFKDVLANQVSLAPPTKRDTF
ncbi:hypothetical protein GCM10029964_124190 [Kibdelosporangium lantanae]